MSQAFYRFEDILFALALHHCWTKPPKWTWRESNPRPNRNPMYFYYHSSFFYIPST